MTSDKIGRYEIIHEIARGGMAIVYLAKDSYMQRHVAVKVLPRVFMHDPQFEKRFTREARVVASLEHPAIVPVYDFGYHGEQPFMVYRFMSGGTLKSKIQSEGAKSLKDTAYSHDWLQRLIKLMTRGSFTVT
jgi:serine/threonine-protein kinase